MRIRSIKPEFWRSKDVTVLSREQRLLFIGVWTYVDDNGVGRDDLAALIGDLFSEDMLADPAGTVDFVRKGLTALAERHLIARYVVDHRGYLKVMKWEAHQRISHPNEARFPDPDDAILEGVRKFSGGSLEVLATGAGEQGSRGAEEQGKTRTRGARLSPDWTPSEALLTYVLEKAPSVNAVDEAETFKNYWQAATGRGAIKLDWDATFRNWVKRQHGWNVEKGWHPEKPGEEYLYQ